MGVACQVHAACGSPSVGAVGMCITGNFALTLMHEPSILAPVICQPALPLDNLAGLEIAREQLAAVVARMDREI